MLRFTIVLAVLVALSSGAPSSPVADCDESMLKSCLSSFASALGFSGGFPKDVGTFNDWLTSDLENNGASGMTSFCSQATKFDNCLGTNAKTCLNAKSLEDVGFDEANAYGYLAAFGQVDNLCGNDYNTILNHFSCVISNFATNTAAINKCQQDLDASIAKDPDNTCTYSQTYLGCVDTFFTVCGSDVKSACCDVAKGGIEVLASQCTLTC